MEGISKQEKQLKKINNKKKELIKRVEKEEKSERIVSLRDNLDLILVRYDMNITAEGEDIVKKLANDERLINYKNLFFKAGNPAIDFLKRFGTLYDFLIDLRNERVGISKARKEQNEMITKINEPGNFVLLEEESINKEKSRGAIKKVKILIKKKVEVL